MTWSDSTNFASASASEKPQITVVVHQKAEQRTHSMRATAVYQGHHHSQVMQRAIESIKLTFHTDGKIACTACGLGPSAPDQFSSLSSASCWNMVVVTFAVHSGCVVPNCLRCRLAICLGSERRSRKTRLASHSLRKRSCGTKRRQATYCACVCVCRSLMW